MEGISKTSMNRITSYTHSQFIGCTKLQIKQEALSPVKMQKMTGGSVVYVNPELAENYPMLAQSTQNNGVGWVLALSAVATAAHHYEEKIGAVVGAVTNTVVNALDQFGDTYSRAWDQIWN